MVMVVGSRILIGVSMGASIAYAWGCLNEMTKLVCCKEVSLRRWEMTYALSSVVRSVGVVVRYSDVTTFMDVRYAMAISMPCVSAWRRYPCVVVWLCADMEGRVRDVGDCTRIEMRHHGAEWASPLRPERRRIGRMRYLVVVDVLSGWVR